MLSVFLVEVLEQKKSVVYYFCTSEDERRNNASAVLRSLLWQLTRIFQDLAQHLLTHLGPEEFAASRKLDVSLSSMETLWMMFTTMCRDPRVDQLVFIIDGLDECDQKSRDWLASKLCDLRTDSNLQHKHPPKIIIVSRVIHRLRLCDKLQLDPDNDGKIGKDIECFVAERVQKLWAMGGFDEKHRQRVESTLLIRSEGTFLWVGFAIAELQTKQTVLEVEQSLDDLPAGLPALYGRMLRRIADQHTEAITKILQWTALSARPFSLSELVEAIHCKATKYHSAVEVVRDLVTLCHPFLVIQSKAGFRETISADRLLVKLEKNAAQGEHAIDGGQTVNLIHQSARDFMDSSEMPALFRFQHEKAHFEMAWRCMDLIQESAREFTESPRMSLASRLRRKKLRLAMHLAMKRKCDQWYMGVERVNPMLEYAVEHWSAHARKASSLAAPLLKHPSGFFDKHSMVRSWWYHQDTQRDPSRGLPDVSDSVSLSAYIGFIPWIEKVLTGGCLRQPALNKKTNWKHFGVTPLMYAADQGHGAAMRILLKHGATAGWRKEAPDQMPAIHVFAASGNELAVRICIEYRTKLLAAGPRQMTPLHLAAAYGHHAVVQLLLAAGADCEAKEIHQKTALMLAATNGHGAVVQVLLDSGAEVGTMDRDGASALDLAAAARQYHVITVSLDRGAPLGDAMALWLAARQGNEPEVRLLLDRGVPVDIKAPRDVTALYCAVIEGHNDVVQVLIDRGAKIEAIMEASDFPGGKTIMHVITTTTISMDYKGFGRLVQLCCDAGVDVNAVDDEGHTALHLAVISGSPSEATITHVQALLDHGAKVDAEDEYGWTPLHHAVQMSLPSDVTRFLLEHGAQADARDHWGRTPLHLGAHPYLHLQLLLNHGADINARDNDGRKAHAKPKKKKKRKKKKKATDHYGWTPLDYAYAELRTGLTRRRAFGTSEHAKA
jgi:ankyrin repeat protein